MWVSVTAAVQQGHTAKQTLAYFPLSRALSLLSLLPFTVVKSAVSSDTAARVCLCVCACMSVSVCALR